MGLGVISLSDIRTNPATGRPHSYQQRAEEIIGYATLADRTGLEVFALGEHHTLDFAVSSPAVVLAAAAARTSRIRLTSGVTVLPVLDPLRVYQDFAALDLVSNGRAEITAGRSAFTEPFDIFGVDIAERVRGAVRGSDAVISALGPSLKRGATGTPVAAGTRNIVNAMQATGVHRFVGLATPFAPSTIS